MRIVLAAGAALSAVVAVGAWLFFGLGQVADAGKDLAALSPPKAPARLVVHEWGTFTSFSGADGVPTSFTPNNTDLPGFVYYTEGGKGSRLNEDGTISMETPVLYFYSNTEQRVSVRVDFPRGWITEWYPFAAKAPVWVWNGLNKPIPGQSIRWDVKLLAGEPARFPTDKGKENHYYQARETDAVPLQAEVTMTEDQFGGLLRGGTVVQQEKFLFYRGVGTFPPPVTVQALGDGKVRVKNGSGDRAGGLVLVTIQGGAVGFKVLDPLDKSAETTASLPAATAKTADLADIMVKEFTAAGLYEKEAQALVRTWETAWFREDGHRLLYLVPRSCTDELLPLTMDPKPAEVVRVLVGRHDFLTPEQEAKAERLVLKERAARAELQAAATELQKIGRFAEQARQMAEKRLDTKAARK